MSGGHGSPRSREPKLCDRRTCAASGRAERREETAAQLDELEQLLADTDAPDVDDDVLKWWREKERNWPHLAKMVSSIFAAPASSAGVERVFSAAGKMHTDLKKSAKGTTLEHSLFAAFNTD